MTSTTPTRTDVLIVGAGPTGMLLAGDLATAGISVTVLERRPEGTSNLSRAFGVHARTLEQLDARGLADDLVATGHPLDALRLFRHLSLDLSRLPSRFPYLLITPQYEVERILQRRAREAGVRFEYGAEVTALRQDQHGVVVDTRTADGTVTAHRAAYVVGTDGHRSAVRSALGLPFPGQAAIKSIVLADVRLSEKPDGLLTVNGTGDAFAFIAPFGDGWYRIMGWDRLSQRPDTDPLDLDEVRDLTRRALGTDYGMYEARWLSRFHSDERQAPAYRVGRVFLAGDAAHVHSPAGGQGMNSGLQDAANLGWKLAAVLRHHADDTLLDTYQSERHPVGRLVLRSSGGIIRLAMAHNPLQRTARDLFARAIARISPLNRKAMGVITGIGISYAADRGAHPLTGKRAPDVRLADGSRLYEALRTGRFVLITPAGPDTPDAPTASDPRVIRTAWTGDRRTTLLVRPDGHIAWASERPDPAGLGKALARWAGPAA
jgi:2-polyprenyl-6-methoxyphenol hydroxylase-like FAD-dependent oxidoreductase